MPGQAGPPSYGGYPAAGPPPQGFPAQAYPAPGYPPYGNQPPGYPVAPGYPAPGYPAPGYGWGAPSAPQPGVIPLRPVNMGELYTGAFATIRANPGVMIGMTAVVVVLSQLITFLVQIPLTTISIGSDNADDDASQIIASTGANLAASLGVSLISMLATTVLTGMLTVVVARSVLGDKTDAGSAWRALKPRLLPLIGVVLLQSLLYAIPAGLLAFLMVVLAGSGSWPAMAAVALLGFLFIVVAALLLMPAFALATAAVVLEGRGPIDSLRRGFQLQSPGYWRLIGILLLTYFVTSIVAAVIGIPFGIGTAFIGTSDSLDTVAGTTVLGLALITVAAAVGQIVTMPFVSSVQTLLYTDQRMRTEQFELVLRSAATYRAQTGVSPGPEMWMPQRPL